MPALSLWTRRSIDWSAILDSSAGLVSRSAKEAVAPQQISKRTSEIRELFRVTKREFAKRSRWLRTLTFLLLGIMIVPIAAHSVGLVLIVREHVIAGASLSTAGVVGLFGVVWQLWAFGSDQIRLEMMPFHYELLFSLCKSDDQYASVLSAFLEETRTLKSGRAP